MNQVERIEAEKWWKGLAENARIWFFLSYNGTLFDCPARKDLTIYDIAAIKFEVDNMGDKQSRANKLIWEMFKNYIT